MTQLTAQSEVMLENRGQRAPKQFLRSPESIPEKSRARMPETNHKKPFQRLVDNLLVVCQRVRNVRSRGNSHYC